MTRPRIFVAIASYRDPECQYTVRDLFLKAAHPERITVGICWQYWPEHDFDCFEIEPPYPDQVREKRYFVHESQGGCWARVEALSLLEDEEFVLQLDAHMRFEPGWDETLLDIHKRCPSEKAMLSATLPPYWPPDHYQDMAGHLAIMRVTQLGKPGDAQPVHLGGYRRELSRLRGTGPVLSAFYVANFMFAPREMVTSVPYDPHIYFRGQEITYTLRTWTHGWDIYQPDVLVAYHYWDSVSRGDDAQAHYKKTSDRSKLAAQRVWHLLGFEDAKDPAALVEIERYGMGKARPRDDFWAFAGIDIPSGTIEEEKGARGYWVPYGDKKA